MTNGLTRRRGHGLFISACVLAVASSSDLIIASGFDVITIYLLANPWLILSSLYAGGALRMGTPVFVAMSLACVGVFLGVVSVCLFTYRGGDLVAVRAVAMHWLGAGLIILSRWALQPKSERERHERGCPRRDPRTPWLADEDGPRTRRKKPPAGPGPFSHLVRERATLQWSDRQGDSPDDPVWVPARFLSLAWLAWDHLRTRAGDICNGGCLSNGRPNQ
jgi:hypothetical protein